MIHPIAVYPPKAYDLDPRFPKSYEDLCLTREMFVEQMEEEIKKGFRIMMTISEDKVISFTSLPSKLVFEGRTYLKADTVFVQGTYAFAVYQHPEHLDYMPKFGVPLRKLFNKE